MSRPGLKKSKTSFSNKSPPVPMSKTPSLLSRKASSMDQFALMSSLENFKMEKEQNIDHFSHPQHPLAPVHSPYLFLCMGCKEYGAGGRFRCQICNFDLHEFCALASPSLQSHPLHTKHQLVFFPKPGGFRLSTCDVCGKSTKGFAYRCSACNFEMHPCCAQFEKQMEFPTHAHPLSLSTESSHSAADSVTLCDECRTKRAGRMYSCSACNYHLHALCAKDMVNGLYVHGIKAPKGQSKIAAAAKLASHVVLGFLGGLLEGIGEGFGEVLIESLAKGNGNTSVDKKGKTT